LPEDDEATASAPAVTPALSEGEAAEEEEGASSGARYRTQRRGGKGLRDIKTTDRNGPVIGIAGVRDDDELLMITARGKMQRIVAGDVSVIGRNTQGVRIMTLDEGDTLAAIVRVPREDTEDATAAGSEPAVPPVAGSKPSPSPPAADPFETSGGDADEEEE
jgi:DNA gyrase subunit A